MPQFPQLFGLVCKFAHPLLQQICPPPQGWFPFGGHPQMPPAQTGAAGFEQALPHAPQFC